MATKPSRPERQQRQQDGRRYQLKAEPRAAAEATCPATTNRATDAAGEALAVPLHHGLGRHYPYSGGNQRFTVAVEPFMLIEGAILRTTDAMLERVGLDIARSGMTRAAAVELVGTRMLRNSWSDDRMP